MGAACKSCKYKCPSKVSEERRKQIFNSCWSLGSYERQKDFVCSSVIENKTKTYLDEDNQMINKKRMVSQTDTLECEGQMHHVCKKFFYAALSLGEVYINHALKHKVGGRFQSSEKKR